MNISHIISLFSRGLVKKRPRVIYWRSDTGLICPPFINATTDILSVAKGFSQMMKIALFFKDCLKVWVRNPNWKIMWCGDGLENSHLGELDYSHKWGNFEPLINLKNQNNLFIFLDLDVQCMRLHWIAMNRETGSLNCIRSQSTRFISVFLFWTMQFIFRLSKIFLSFQNSLVGVLIGSTRKCIMHYASNRAVLWVRMYESPLSCLGGLRVSWIHFRWWKTETQNTMISKCQTQALNV